MAKNSDWSASQDVKDIVERFIEHFPGIFEGFDADGIHFILTKKKKSRVPLKIHAVGYPNEVFGGKPYIVETFEVWWATMDAKRKNIAVFAAMDHIPDGGFDEQSKHYGKIRQPDIKMHMLTFAACGGVPNWLENPAAKDPMKQTPDEVAECVPRVDAIPADDSDAGATRTPVMPADIANVGTADGEVAA